MHLEEAASVCGGRGVTYGISIDFRPKSLARSGFCEKGSLLMLIDLSMKASPQDGLIVT